MTVLQTRLTMALEKSRRTMFQWITVSAFGFLPMIIGVYALGHLTMSSKIPSLQNPKVPNYIADAVPFFFLFMIVEYFVLTIKGKRTYYRLNDSINSISMGIFQQMMGIIWKSLGVFPYAFIRHHFQVWEFDDDQDIPFTHPVWWGMFFMAEFGYYWFHRFSHEWNSLWAGHVVHHSSEEYNLSTALRQGSISSAFSWVFYLLGAPFFPIRLYLVHIQFNTLYQFWIHTRAIDKLPWPIEYIFNTPSHHRVHHGRNARYIDKNYGGTLIIFDRIFGTFQAEDEDPKYGITYYLGSWNPFYLQFHHWTEIWRACQKTNGIINKIRVFIDRGPSYNWHVLYGEIDYQPRDQAQKWDSNVPNLIMSIYVCIHFAIVILASYLILEANQLPIHQRFMGIAWIFLGLYGISALMDQKKWAGNVEVFRFILAIVAIIYYQPQPSMPSLVGLCFATITSIGTLMYYYRTPLSKKTE